MKLRRPPRRGARIEMIPVIDAIFLILVAFTYAVISMISPRGMRVRLPRVEGTTSVGKEPVAITIGRRGELYVDRERVTRDRLVTTVKSKLGGDDEGWVLIHGDAQAPLETALSVLGRLREGGIDRVTFRAARPKAGEGDSDTGGESDSTR